jgi:lipid-A-disaccharide synthase
MVEVDCVAMPNLIAGESIVPELLQSEAQPERIADALQAHLTGPVRARQLERFAALRCALPGGAPQRTAAIALEMLDARRAA